MTRSAPFARRCARPGCAPSGPTAPTPAARAGMTRRPRRAAPRPRRPTRPAAPGAPPTAGSRRCAPPDLPWRERSRLKRGDYAWEAGLDLHGYTLEEARTELEGFLREAAARRQRCVLVVHGKAWGTTSDYPVIKSHVNAWLREWPGVLAFCSATDGDGGTGAVYVLLRRRGDP